MAEKPFGKDDKVDVIDRQGPYIQESFDLKRMDDFVTGLGVEYLHYTAMPSPIGKNDRGDYRRNDGVDTITSNGMLYECSGKFTATMTDNSRERERGAAGTLDPSESKLVMPRFYNSEKGIAAGERIYLMPGDRIYVADHKVDDLVVNAQWMDYEDGVPNVPMFPVAKMLRKIKDSRNIEYLEDVDYHISKDGNICWISGGQNPGIDPNTSKGRVYSVRYLYRAYWYITQLPKEVRITNVTDESGNRVPTRAAYHAIAQREYIYHNQNSGAKTNQNKPKDPRRKVQAPTEPRNPAKYSVPVDISAVGDNGSDDDQQS
jgi:hypothetical protein